MEQTRSTIRIRRRASTETAANVPAEQQWLWANGAALNAVLEGICDVEAGRVVDDGLEFLQYADIEIDD